MRDFIASPRGFRSGQRRSLATPDSPLRAWRNEMLLSKPGSESPDGLAISKTAVFLDFCASRCEKMREMDYGQRPRSMKIILSAALVGLFAAGILCVLL